MTVAPLLAFALPALAVLGAAVGVHLRHDRRLASVRVGIAGWEGGAGPIGSRPEPEWGAVLARLGRTGPGRRLGGATRHGRQVELAGDPWTVDRVAGLKLALCIALGIVVLGMAGATPLALPGMALAAGAGVGAPEVALIRAGRRRQAGLERQVPDLVELLVATTEAGLSPVVAFRRASELLLDPLGHELRRSVREIDLGLSWREALGRLVARTEVASLRRLVATMARSGRLGTPVRAALRGVAEDLRGERRAQAEERARKAPVKMLFPLVFLILPAFLLLTVGPVVVATLRSLRSG